MLSDGATHEAVHLLCRMLVFDPVGLFWWLSPGRSSVVGDICVRCWPVFTCFFTVSRPSGSPAATRSPTRTWTKVVCATTPACVSAATPSPAAGFTRVTLSRWRSGHSATATKTVCCRCGRAKVRRRRRRQVRLRDVSDISLCPDLRVDPPVHHRAPAGEACAAVHQPSERCVQDLHQVRWMAARAAVRVRRLADVQRLPRSTAWHSSKVSRKEER